MIIRSVPKSAVPREIVGKFSFDMQVSGPYVGQYACTNNIIQSLPMNMNTFYLLDDISISASIPEDVFVNSLQDDLIQFELVRYLKNELITSQPLTISQYYKNRQLSMFIPCNKEGDGIAIRVKNRLDQVAETIGIDTIYLVISALTYEIDGNEYNTMFRDKDV